MATDKTERYELSRIGATPTKNSGRGAHHKGDGILTGDSGEDVYTVDVKEYANSYSLSRVNLAKISTDARKNKTQPLLQVTLGTEEPRVRWIAIPEDMFMEMWEEYKKTV